MKHIKFTDVYPNGPTLFRYIIVEEETGDDAVMCSPVKMYCAVAMEWYQTAQGDTPEKAVQSLEHCMMGNAAIKLEHPSHEIGPAPEDYQRVATSGDIFISSHKGWNDVFGQRKWPIVARGVLDMEQSKMRLVMKGPTC